MASSTREISALIILLTKYYIELYFVSIANHKPCSFVKTCSRFSVRPEHVSEQYCDFMINLNLSPGNVVIKPWQK